MRTKSTSIKKRLSHLNKMAHLFSHHDPYHIHAFFGFLTLFHFFYRFTQLLKDVEDSGFGVDINQDILCLLIMILPNLTSFLFRTRMMTLPRVSCSRLVWQMTVCTMSRLAWIAFGTQSQWRRLVLNRALCHQILLRALVSGRMWLEVQPQVRCHHQTLRRRRIPYGISCRVRRVRRPLCNHRRHHPITC